MYCMCPSCGRRHHVRQLDEYADDDAWIAKVAPDTKPGETPRVPCLDCWKASRKNEAPS